MNELRDLLIQEGVTLEHAMRKIDESGARLCFVIDTNHKLKGVITDGEARRAILRGETLNTLVNEVMNKTPVTLPVGARNAEIISLLNDRITIIPLLDDTGTIVDYASKYRLRRIPVAEPVLKGNELAYVTEAIKSTWISSTGKYVNQFQKQFEDYCKMPYALAVSNGTVAIHLALVALDIGPEDEVIVPDLTFAASINAIIYAGATPVLIDVDPETYNLRTDQLEELITPATKAIMPVHLYGYPAEMNEIVRIANKHNLIIVEDAAEALGSTYDKQPVGSFGAAATFSFFGNKTVTTGEGGMVVFKDEKIFLRAKQLRDHGMNPKKRYWHDEVGFNYRMTNVQAAIGVAQMENVESLVLGKRNVAQAYSSILHKVPGLVLPPDNDFQKSSYWLYTIGLPEGTDRSALIKQLLGKGIETRPVFYPLHVMPPYRKYVLPGQSFPGAELASGRGMSLPSAASLTETEAKYVANALLDTFQG